MNDKIQLKRGTLANWLNADPILLDGEMALVATNPSTPNVYDQYKVGGGSKKFSELPYQGLPCLQELGDSTTSPLSQKAITDWINKGYQFRGIATPSTNPGTPDGPVFYIASEAGTYSNFNGISVADGEAVILEWEGNWVKKTTGFATQQQIVRLDEKIDDKTNEINVAKEEALQAIAENEQSTIANFNSQRVTPEMLSESTKQLIEASGGGTITNLADDEDLTSVDDGTGSNVLKFADRTYNADNFSGKGYKILRKNIVDGKNVLTQDMINQPNTIYEIRYDFDLNGQEIILAKNSEIKYTSGSISNGQILYNDSTTIVKSNSSIKNFSNLQKIITNNINFVDYLEETDIIDYNGAKCIVINSVLKRIRDSFYNKNQLLHIDFPVYAEYKFANSYVFAITGPIDLKNLYLDFKMSLVWIINTKKTDTIFYWSSPNSSNTPNLSMGGIKNVLQFQQFSDIDKIMDMTNFNSSYGIENISWWSFGGHANYGLYQPYINASKSYLDYRVLKKISININRYDTFENKDIIPYNILCLGDGGKIIQCSFNNLCLFGCGGMTIENCENLSLILAYSTVDIVSNYCEYLGTIKIIYSKINFIGGVYIANSRVDYEKYRGDYIRVDVQEDIDNFNNIVYSKLTVENSRKLPTARNSYVDFTNMNINSTNWLYRNAFAGYLIHKENYCKLINVPTSVPINNNFHTNITYCNAELSVASYFSKYSINTDDAFLNGIDFDNTNMEIIGVFLELDESRKLYHKFKNPTNIVTLNTNQVAFINIASINNYNDTIDLEPAFNVLKLVFVIKINDIIYYGKYCLDNNSTKISKIITQIIPIHKTHYKEYEYIFGDSFLEKDNGFYKTLVDGNYNNALCVNTNYNLDYRLNKKDYFYNANGFYSAITVKDIDTLKALSLLKDEDIIYEKTTNIKYIVVKGKLHNITQISGNTANRPTKGLYSGFTYYDIDLNKNIVWNGSIWTNIDGTSLNINKSGTTTERPTNVDIGFIYKDTTLNKLILWEGSKWVNLDGTELS